jgi:hypothetical protein
MNRRRSIHLSVLRWLLLALVAAPLALTPTPALARQHAAGVFYELRHLEYPFSPNADGHRDTMNDVYILDEAAHVWLQVRRHERLVALIDLGTHRAGAHRTNWDGTDGDGHVLRDGEYGLRIVARPGDGSVLRSKWLLGARIDTTIRPATATSDWPLVYPMATAVHDSVWLTILARTANSAELHRASGRVFRHSGRLVRALSWKSALYECGGVDGGFGCGYGWSWTGKAGGRPLPAGRYRIALTLEDQAGNWSRRSVWVRVSHQELTPTLQTVTVTATESIPTPRPSPPGCNGCGEDNTCGDAVAPGRFGPTSLSYRSDDTCPYTESAAREYHLATFAPAAAGGAYRVTAYGGPTLPGAPDQGTLVVDVDSTTATDTPDDHETTSAWIYPDYPGRTAQRVSWWFETHRKDSYDVAWYRLEVTTYQPVT